jgi:DNA-binding transcriptional MocR family regulator
LEQKMARGARLWSISALSTELQRNARTIVRALQGTPADGTIKGGHRGWHLGTALQALAAYERQCDQLSQRGSMHGNGEAGFVSSPGALMQVVDQIEGTASTLEGAMQRTRAEPDITKRREMISEWGPVVDQLDSLLRQSFELQGEETWLTPFGDKVLGTLIAEICELGGWPVPEPQS